MFTWFKAVTAFIDVRDVILLLEDGRIVVGVGDRDPQVDDRLLPLAVVVRRRVGQEVGLRLFVILEYYKNNVKLETFVKYVIKIGRERKITLSKMKQI
jgi:hypothetical protein